MERDPLDREIIRSLIDLGDGTDSLLRELVGVFALNSEALLADLRGGVGDGCAERVGEAAHSLKSSSGTVGALRLSKMCEDAEEAAREAGWERIGRLVEAIETELAIVRARLNETIAG